MAVKSGDEIVRSTTAFMPLLPLLALDQAMSYNGSLYYPLQADDIRVFDLHPGSFEDPIECHLQHQKRNLDGGFLY
jgi:hypothetical protein